MPEHVNLHLIIDSQIHQSVGVSALAEPLLHAQELDPGGGAVCSIPVQSERSDESDEGWKKRPPG